MLHDRYRVLKSLDQDGFAKTFLALDTHKAHDAFCVIKQLFLHQHTRSEQYPSEQYPSEQRTSEQFQQAAQRLADVGNHPQLPQWLDAFEQDGQAFIVQEWIDGWTLAEEIAGTVPFDEVEIWQLLRSLLPVLHYLHNHQIIHQDIKPTNIIRRRACHPIPSLQESSRVELVLVGFSVPELVLVPKLVDEERCRDVAPLMGSAEYAAPEQMLGRAVFASDLYSLGLTCLYLLTQMSPFDLYDMSDATWKWDAYLLQPISPALKQLLSTLLQPTRRRYQSAAEVLVAIETAALQCQKPSILVSHTQVKQADGIAPLPLAKAHAATTSPGVAKANVLPCAIAAINTARLSQSIAAATVYSPHERRWYFFPSEETTDLGNVVCLESHRLKSHHVEPHQLESHLTDTTLSDATLADAIARSHQWETHSPNGCEPLNRAHPLGWRLFTVGISTAVASVAMTCLWLCIGIIFLALAVPTHSNATSSQAKPSAAPR